MSQKPKNKFMTKCNKNWQKIKLRCNKAEEITKEEVATITITNAMVGATKTEMADKNTRRSPTRNTKPSHKKEEATVMEDNIDNKNVVKQKIRMYSKNQKLKSSTLVTTPYKKNANKISIISFSNRRFNRMQ